MSVLIIIIFAIIITLLLTRQQEPARIDNNNLTDLVDSLLPQTQCGKCGYPACRPYAQAIVENKADINQCPPGGRNTIRHIARLLGRELKPLDPEFGRSGPKRVAVIDEAACIGCVKCIKACPVDAIIGAPKQMHTVIEQECTGCELCIEPCPVDCIDMLVYIQGGKRVNPELNSDQIKAGS